MRLLRLILLASLSVALAPSAPAEELVLVAGGTVESEPVSATAGKLRGPFAVDFNSAGTLFLVEMPGQRVRMIDTAGQLTTIGGDGEPGNSGDGGPARQARFRDMHSLAVGPSGEIYIADTGNKRIRKIDPSGRSIGPFAGTGEKGFSGDGGPAAAAQFGGVYCLALSARSERMYVADLDNRRIRAINMATGIVETVAGNGQRGVPQDGADAKASPLVDPRAVAVDRQENIYILERAGNSLRVVDRQGHIRTLIGGTARVRDEEDRDPAPLKGPKHLCVDAEGNVLIADTENHTIRKYLPKQAKLIRIAGTGQPGATGLDGAPRDAQLKQPHGVTVHRSGEIYIADSSNDRIVTIVP